MIVFELRQWEGEYWSKDVAYGVEFSPYTSTIFTVPADGSAPPRRIPVEMDMDGANQRQLTFRKTPCGRATYGPRGKQIAFVSWVDKHVQLFVMDSDGGEPRQITEVQGAICSLGWRRR